MGVEDTTEDTAETAGAAETAGTAETADDTNDSDILLLLVSNRYSLATQCC